MEVIKGESPDMDLDYPQQQFASHHLQQSSQSSNGSADSPSTAQSPYSSRAYARSSASSVASSVYRESMEGFGSIKRPLTDVKEEPQEREEGLGLMNADQLFGPQRDILLPSMPLVESPAVADAPVEPANTDHVFTDSGLFTSGSQKKRRSGESPLAGVTARIGTRFPSLSRKLRSRSRTESGLTLDLLDDATPSRTSSIGSTMHSPNVNAVSKHDGHLPPSPARTVFEDSGRDPGIAPIDINKANDHTSEEDEGQARTPLLPPLMVDFPAHLKESPVQSPLPSPTVAETTTTSIIHTPVDTPRVLGLPSPPLSSKPSMSSLHHSRNLPVLSSVDMPSISMSDPDDEWSRKLGHANFNIHPDPYCPETKDVESYKQFRANWELARCNYTKHLVRTGEHYGSTSKIYKFTEEKWVQVDLQWKRHNESILSSLDKTAEEVIDLSKQSAAPAPPIKIPPLDDPHGRFPELGDEDIVGPMTVSPVTRTLSEGQARISRKRTFLKFLQDFKTSTGLLLGRASKH